MVIGTTGSSGGGLDGEMYGYKVEDYRIVRVDKRVGGFEQIWPRLL